MKRFRFMLALFVTLLSTCNKCVCGWFTRIAPSALSTRCYRRRVPRSDDCLPPSANSQGNGGEERGMATFPWSRLRRRRQWSVQGNAAYDEEKAVDVSTFSSWRSGVDSLVSSETNTELPLMLILVGLPGSGKSTFATALVNARPDKFIRINQDTLKTRKRCEAACRQAFQEGLCPIVDRCNFDISQRRHFINLVQQQFGTNLTTEGDPAMDCVVFSYPVEICAIRCQERTSHETLPPEDAAKIVGMVNKQYDPPQRPLQGLQEARIAGEMLEVNSGADYEELESQGETFRCVYEVKSFNASDALVQYLAKQEYGNHGALQTNQVQ